MGSFEMTCVNLECGDCHHISTLSNDDDQESLFYSEPSEEDPYYSLIFSTSDSSTDGHDVVSEEEEVSDCRRVSSVIGSECCVDIKCSVHEIYCRICHLSLQEINSNLESEVVINLGCSCKNDLAAAHQHCAETWFKIKGDKICEICNSIAQNIVGLDYIRLPQVSETSIVAANERYVVGYDHVRLTQQYDHVRLTQQVNETNNFTADAASVPTLSILDTHLNGHLLDLLVACIVFVVFMVWIFPLHMAI